jgi:hypothetical protein
MPKARTGNFTLRKIVAACPADKAAHRFTALQRSGRYSELRLIQRGKSFDIVGYQWPDKGVRRQLGIGRARKNPTPAGKATPNQVLFGSRGKTVVGWINKATPTQYQITSKVGAQTRTVWRPKNRVKFQTTGKYGKLAKIANLCPKTANPGAELAAAARLSQAFHGAPPRKVKSVNIKWPRAMTKIGDCAQVDYISDKWDGKLKQYFHRFEKPAELFTDTKPQADGSMIMVIRGQFRIKPEGITG